MFNVLERAGSLNVKFNPDKFQCRVPEKTDPSHIKGIVDMPTPHLPMSKYRIT